MRYCDPHFNYHTVETMNSQEIGIHPHPAPPEESYALEEENLNPMLVSGETFLLERGLQFVRVS